MGINFDRTYNNNSRNSILLKGVKNATEKKIQTGEYILTNLN